jgi:hypothetical protein
MKIKPFGLNRHTLFIPRSLTAKRFVTERPEKETQFGAGRRNNGIPKRIDETPKRGQWGSKKGRRDTKKD